MKWLRNFAIFIQTPDMDVLEIRPPFTVQFDVTRNTLASANTCNLTINNLSKNIRNRIYKDRYNTTAYWQVIIQAGYKNLYTVFQGNILQSMSFKQDTEWITQIECYDGLYGMQNGVVSETVSAGTKNKKILDTIISSMPNMAKGLFGSFGEESSGDRGQVLMGGSYGVLNEYTGGKVFVDNETVNVMDDDEVLSDRVAVLDKNQLFSSPKRQDTNLEVDILFAPELSVGSYCELRSLDEIYDGQYKVLGFKHSVVISSSQAGEAKTSLTLYAGAKAFQEVSA